MQVAERWVRLGVPRGRLESDWQAAKRAVLHRRQRPADTEACPSESDVTIPSECLQIHILQYPAADDPSPLNLARDVLPAAKSFFFGDWRDDPDLAESKRGSHGWYGGYRCAIVAALALQADPPVLGQLLQWPDDDLVYDESAWDVTREDNLIHIEFAKWMRGHARDMARVRNKMGKVRQSHPQLLLGACEAIVASDLPALGQALRGLVEWHQARLEKERKRGFYYPWLSIDASLVWLAARWKGADVQQCNLAQEHRDYLIDLVDQPATPLMEDVAPSAVSKRKRKTGKS